MDVSILTIKENTFQVMSTAGNTHLGGADFDNRMVMHFAKVFYDKYATSISSDKHAMCRLLIACEKAKCDLSFSTEARIEIDDLFKG